MANTVIEALRRFLPAYCKEQKVLTPERRRAIWAIEHCRTAEMGGRLWGCGCCGRREFRYHSCNHRNCPQCGKTDTADWVRAQMNRRVGSPYFMVNFTLPEAFRELFFGPSSKTLYDLFFSAAARALRETLADARWLGAQTSGFSMILHTWNQRLLFHPHIHAIVPGAGIDGHGHVVTVSSADYLVRVPTLRYRFIRAFREAFQKLPSEERVKIDTKVWSKSWGIYIKEFGRGSNIIKYLGAYVCRTAIGDSRIVSISKKTVTFRWKDRAHGCVIKEATLPGEEFVRRYLLHVAPKGLKTIRHYGFLHPAAKDKCAHIAFHTERPLEIDESHPRAEKPQNSCSLCGSRLRIIRVFTPQWNLSRAPPISLHEKTA